MYTLSNPVYSYTGATLAPLQCTHSVCLVYTLTGTGSGTVSSLSTEISPVFESMESHFCRLTFRIGTSLLKYIETSALIVQSHDDREVGALTVKIMYC